MGEGERVLDRAVYVALGCKVDYSVHVVVLHQLLYSLIIADVGLDEHVVLLVLHVLQVGKVAGIGQLVEVDDAVLGILVYEQAHYVGADEARSACDDYVTLEFHDFSFCVLHIYKLLSPVLFSSSIT